MNIKSQKSQNTQFLKSKMIGEIHKEKYIPIEPILLKVKITLNRIIYQHKILSINLQMKIILLI